MLVVNLPHMFGIDCQNDWITLKKKGPMPPNFYFCYSKNFIMIFEN
jgi:hypothetical protein